MCIHWSDENWYALFLQGDPVARPLNSSQKSSIIRLSMQEAKRQKQTLQLRFGTTDPGRCLQMLGYRIEEESPELMLHFLYMGLTVPDERKVCLNRTVLGVLEQYMRAHFPPTDPRLEKLRAIVLYHELFHVLEETSEGMYTRSACATRRLLGFIPWKSRVEAASEIGAVHFSKLMAEADFSPCLYTRYLLAATNQKTDMDGAFGDGKEGRGK